jgi:hypothetical protein
MDKIKFTIKADNAEPALWQFVGELVNKIVKLGGTKSEAQ